jgi:mono/diheme cytochrome c family protein
MRLHRMLGWIYAAIYAVLMSQMIPRLWRYQVEFPPRTVAHLMLGMTIGAILLIKIVIVRFFKHLEGTLAPFLGTTLLVCTVLLLGLSVPFSLRAIYLERSLPGGSAFSSENMARVAALIPRAGFPREAPLDRLSSVDGLRRGQSVMLNTCVQCHDLRTILARPRTPEDWVATVKRMGDRATVLQPIAPADEWFAAAYLIAISPQLQKAVLQRRESMIVTAAATQAVAAPESLLATSAETFDLAECKKVFESNCVKCHSLSSISDNPPTTDAEASELVQRMVGNGLTLPRRDLQQITFYLRSTYVK